MFIYRVILCPETAEGKNTPTKLVKKWSVEGESTGKNKYADGICHTKRIQ